MADLRGSLSAYEDCSVIGLRTGDGRILLNPPMDTRVSARDAIILIAEDDSEISLSENADPRSMSARSASHFRAADARAHLVLGLNDRAPTMIAQLDGYVPAGSEVTVVAAEGAGLPAQFDGLNHQTVTFRAGNTTDRRELDALEVSSYDHVIVLSYSDELDPEEADSRTLWSPCCTCARSPTGAAGRSP